MITYSRQEMERQLVSDQVLWRKVPVMVGSLLWPLEIVLLGWNAGWWMGGVTVLALGMVSVAVPPGLKVSVYLIDLLERLLRLRLGLCWLLLVWHLWLREPLFPIFGQPIGGALVATAALLVATRLLAFAARFAAKRVSAK